MRRLWLLRLPSLDVLEIMMALFYLLIMSLLFGLVFITRYFIDYHLQRSMNAFLPMEFRRRSLDEIVCELLFFFFFRSRL